MSAARLLGTLTSLGVRLWVEGDRLEVEAPAGALDPDLLAQLRAHKAALLPQLTAQNAGAYLDSIALTVAMSDACQDLADVSPPTDPASWQAAHQRYQTCADRVRTWYRQILPVDPGMAEEFNQSLKARLYQIRDAWRARHPETSGRV